MNKSFAAFPSDGVNNKRQLYFMEGFMKLQAILSVFCLCSLANASIVSIDFETSEGYPATSADGTQVWLYSHGWYDTSSAWVVPYITSDTFAHTGLRSAIVWTLCNAGQQWCSYHSEWTPSQDADTVSYSAYMAIQKSSYGSSDSTSYGGIVLRGKKSDLTTEVTLGGIQLLLNGSVKAWGFPAGTYAEIGGNYPCELDQWNRLEIIADFTSDQVHFYVGSNSVGSFSFDSDVVKLSSIGIYTGAGDKWSMGNNIRFDAINVDAIPEPTTIALLGLGVLGLLRRK